MGDGVVRCIAMGSSDGLKRGVEVSNTGVPISVPIGEGTLGRIMDVLGEGATAGGKTQPVRQLCAVSFGRCIGQRVAAVRVAERVGRKRVAERAPLRRRLVRDLVRYRRRGVRRGARRAIDPDFFGLGKG